nr:copia protein [Tanacetum cinerariifolium]
MLPLWSFISYSYKSSDDKAEDDKPKDDTGSKTVVESVYKENQAYKDELNRLMSQEKEASDVDSLKDTVELRCTGIFTSSYDDDLDTFTSPIQSVGAEADFNNMESSIVISHIPTHRVHIHYLKDQMQGDPQSVVQTRRMAKKSSGAHAFLSYIHKQRRTNHNNYENCLFAYFLLQLEPKKVYRNTKDKRDIVVRNKARLVAQGHRQEEGIDYDEVFAPVARIEAIKIFLAFASLTGFVVYEMDVKSAFLYVTIEEEVYNGYIRGIIDKTLFIKKDKDDIMLVQVYVDDIIFGFTKKSLCDDFEALMHKRFQMSSIGEPTFFLGLQIFRYLKGQPKLGLWYPKDFLFDLEAYSDSVYVGANLNRKSTTRGCQFLIRRLISCQCRKQTIVATSTTEVEDSYEKKLIQVLKIQIEDNVADLLTKDFDVSRDGMMFDLGRGDSLVRAATIASLDTQQDSSNIAKTQSKATLNAPNPQGEGSGNTVRSGEDRMEHAIKLTDLIPQTPHDSPLSGGHTPRSDEGSMTLKELTDLCITLSQKVLDLRKVKTAQAKEIARGNTIETVNTARPDISAARLEVNIVAPKSPAITTTLFDDEDVTIANTLVKMKTQKAQEKGVAFKDVNDSARPIRSITTLQLLITINPKDKGKGILQEPKPVKKTKKRDQDQFERDAEVALKIQADLDEEVRTERERQEEASKAALAGLYDEVQVRIDADHELAARLTHEEQEKYTVEERSKLLAEFFERRNK